MIRKLDIETFVFWAFSWVNADYGYPLLLSAAASAIDMLDEEKPGEWVK